MSNLITNAFKLNNINQFIESIDETSNSVYYVFTAKHTEYSIGDSNVPSPVDTEESIIDITREMIFGKRITSSDVIPVVVRNDWTYGNVYTEYDDTDSYLYSKPFYAIVNTSSQYHVFKCLYNNGNTASTVEPDYSSVDPEDEYYQTSDGYIWEYMYSANSSIVDKFATPDYFPVITNNAIRATDIAANAHGKIDIIKVIGAGNNYNNYVAGNNYFGTTDIAIGSNTLLYDISSNSSTSSSNDYYNDCYIYIKADSNTQNIGLYRKITDYIVESGNKKIQLANAFPTNAITTSSVWEIYPGVIIEGDGSEIINAEARAIVNSTGNSIHRIDMLESGREYRRATAFVYAYPDVGASNATLKVIKSPHFNHGSNNALELASTRMAVSVTFSGTEGNTITMDNDYRTIGIIKDPIFNEVTINANTISGTFLTNEKIYKISPMRLGVDAVLDSTNTTIISVNGDFENQYSANDYIYLYDGINHMLSKIDSVTNATSLDLTTNASFTSSNVYYYNANVTSYADITSANSTVVVTSNLVGTISTGDIMIGNSSGAYLTVNSISRAGTTKNFNTFINMYKYTGTVISGTFQEDEIVYQTDLNTSNAVLHSVSNNGTNKTLYVSNKFGESFIVPHEIIGNSSDAIFNATEAYKPEIAFRTGDIIFLENVSPISREENQSETLKFIFNF